MAIIGAIKRIISVERILRKFSFSWLRRFGAGDSGGS
jgi:hypothetical protein